MSSKFLEYATLHSELNRTSTKQLAKSKGYRLKQLQNLLKMLEIEEQSLLDAVHQDLSKPKFECLIMEIIYVKGELINAINNLSKWMSLQTVEKDPVNTFNTAGYYYHPYGVVLIIGAWNYPLSLNLQPLVGAIAAGNCVVVKPSEIATHTTAKLKELLEKYLDPACFRVVNGGIPESQALLEEKWDYIFYTGSSAVGKIVMKAAANNLTPVTLELGGKCPCYVASDCGFDIAANRILWAKCANAGQTCLAPDYILCDKVVEKKLIESMEKTLMKFFGPDPQTSESFGRIINTKHCNFASGKCETNENYISPTVMINVERNDAIMKEEIFGPILPIISIRSLEEAIDFVNSGENPLAAYVFSKDSQTADEFISKTLSGSVCVNDCLTQAAVPTLPFGGVGKSGIGCYHSKFTFETFSHRKSCLFKKQTMEWIESLRYPPYSQSKFMASVFKFLLIPKQIPGASFLPWMLFAALASIVYQLFDIRISWR